MDAASLTVLACDQVWPSLCDCVSAQERTCERVVLSKVPTERVTPVLTVRESAWETPCASLMARESVCACDSVCAWESVWAWECCAAEVVVVVVPQDSPAVSPSETS